MARGLHGPVAAHKPSPLRFWRIDRFNCWSAVAGWPELTGNSSLAQSRRCRLIAVMTSAVRQLGPMHCTRLSERCLPTPQLTVFCHSADPSFLSHDRVSSAPCLRAAAQSHAATSTGIHTHLRALERHWLHSQRGGAICVFVCAQDRPTPHTAALTARLPHAHGGGCCGRSDSGLSCFLGCEVPFVVCVGDSNHRGVSRSSCCRRRARRSWSVRASPKSTPIPPKKPLHIQK